MNDYSPIFDAWFNAEKAIFEYLVKETSSLPDVSGYLGKLPITAAKVNDLKEWCFRFAPGNGDVAHRPEPPQRGKVTSWKHAAIIEARFTNRVLAIRFISVLRGCLPVGRGDSGDTPMPNVARFYLLGHPSCNPGTVEIDVKKTDEGRAGIVETWEVAASGEVAYDIVLSVGE